MLSSRNYCLMETTIMFETNSDQVRYFANLLVIGDESFLF